MQKKKSHQFLIPFLCIAMLASCANNPDSKRCTVSYDTDGGSLVPPQEVEYGSVATKSSYEPSKTGWTFTGWYYTDSSGSESLYPFTIAVTEDITLRAKYKINSYKVEFSKNGAAQSSGSMKSVRHTYGTEYPLPKNTFTSVGATFAGWSRDANATEPEFSDRETVQNLSSIDNDTVTLYAVWNDNPYHHIEYRNLNGGIHSNTRKFIERQNVELSDAELTGYDFNGWFLSEDFSGKRIYGWSAGEKTQDVTLWAKWVPKTYTVQLNDRGTLGTLSVNYGDEFQPIQIPTVSGGTFLGYYTEPYSGGEQFINAAGKGVVLYNFTKDMELYASWAYDIEFDTSRLPEGTSYMNSNSSTYIHSGSTDVALLPLMLKKGYTFDGWLDQYGNAADKIPAGTSGKQTFYASGITLVEYTLTYETNGGEWDSVGGQYEPPRILSIESEDICLPRSCDINKEGYAFAGWYDNAELGGDPIAIIPKGTTQNIKLWAKWEEVTE